MKKIKKIIEEIFDDLSDRSGFDNQLSQTDKDVKEEMKDKWESIIKSILEIE